MEYVVFKNSLALLYVELPEEFRHRIEIICIETQDELENYLKVNNVKLYHEHSLQPVSDTKTENDVTTTLDSLFIRQNDYFKKIPFASIMWIEASRSYSYIHVVDKPQIITTHPLSGVRKKLPPELFIQIHRSFIVNKNFVDKFVGNTLYIGKESFPISKKLRSNVFSHFLFLDNIKDPLEKARTLFGNNNEPLENNVTESKE